MTLREFIHSHPLVNDKGRRIDVTTPVFSRVVDALERSRRVVLAGSRRIGKSTVASAVALYHLSKPLAEILYVAGSVDQASAIITGKLGKIMKLSPMKDRFRVSETGITCDALASNLKVIAANDHAAGRSPTLVVIDEPRQIDRESLEVILAGTEAASVLFVGSPSAPGSWWYNLVFSPPPDCEVINFADPLDAKNPELKASYVEAERARLRAQGAFGECMATREWGGAGVNAWVDISENPFLNWSDIERARRPSVEPHHADDLVVVGLDLSLRRDITSATVLAARNGHYRVLEIWQLDPKVEGEVDFGYVEAKVNLLLRKYSAEVLVLDEYQGAYLASRIRDTGICQVRTVAMSAATNLRIFEALAENLRANNISWSAGAAADRLEAELRGLRVHESVTGAFTVREASSRRFHRDLAVSCSLALDVAIDRGGGMVFHRKSNWDFEGDDVQRIRWFDPATPPTRAELDARELRIAENNYADALRRLLERSARAGA